MNRVFLYGSLVHRITRQRLLGKKPVRTVVLDRFSRRSVPIGHVDYPTLVHSNGTVVGEILELTDQELEKLDRYEEKYRRVRVELADGTQAWVYVLEGSRW